jgi:hypothetical protein
MAAAGWGACACSLLWVQNPLLAVVCGPIAILGAVLGDRIVGVIEAPTRRAVLASTASIGLFIPIVSGMLDLYWRAHTP